MPSDAMRPAIKRQKTTSILNSSVKNRSNFIKALANKNSDRFTNKLKNFYRSFDVFGERVELTFKGKRSYQTDIGAFVSILIKLVLTIFIFYELYVIFARKHPRVSVKYAL